MKNLSGGLRGLLAVGTLGIGLLQAPGVCAEGFELGGRTGFGIPLGELALDSDLKETVALQVPFMFDMGLRVSPALFLGGYLNLGIGVPGEELRDACDALDAECGAVALAGGFQFQYHLAPSSGADFWFGAGFGFESLAATLSNSDTELSSGFAAFPQLMLQLGVDLGRHRKVGYGPFVSFTHSTFSSVSSSCEGSCGVDGEFIGSGDVHTTDIARGWQAGHQWLIIGFRVTFVPRG